MADSTNTTSSSRDELKTAHPQEVIEQSEGPLIEAIRLIIEERMRRSYAPDETVQRDAHAKTHGLVKAKFTVVDDLPTELRHGVFAEPRTFDAMVRFSASSQVAKPDPDLQPQGMAIKVLGVDGEKLIGESSSQDFVMINFPTFFVSNLQDYIDFMRVTSVLSLGPDDGGDVEATLETFAKMQPEQAAIVEKMVATPFFHPMQVQYWSQVPFLLGENVIKYSAKPLTSDENRKPEGEPGDLFLRNALVETIGREVVEYELLVQVQNDPEKQPVEDSTVEWDEADAPPQRVATIEIPVQDLSSGEDLELAEKMAFTVWNSLPSHHPLGSMNRARRMAYNSGMKVRLARNHDERLEPAAGA